MNGKIVADRVVLEGGDELSLEEAAYLVEKDKIDVFGNDKELTLEEFMRMASSLRDGFGLRYIVYKDLRERGYHVRSYTTNFDFGLYHRGGIRKTVEYFVHVFSEREPLRLDDIARRLDEARNVRKRMAIAIVDEEGDVTFYEVRGLEFNLDRSTEGERCFLEGKGNATLLYDRVIVWDFTLSEELSKNGLFGKLDDEKLQLSLVESAYLIKKGNIEVVDESGRKLDFDTFLNVSKGMERDFVMKYAVYEDLREKGMIVKTGFKFGSHFRIYDRMPSSASASHSKYLVHAVAPDHQFFLPDISRAVRLAHGVRKRMVFAYLGRVPSVNRYKRLNHINYVDMRRLKL